MKWINQKLVCLLKQAWQLLLHKFCHLLRFPYATRGSIKAAALVPLMIYAYRWGGTRGIFVGVVYGILHFILGFKSSVHYLSIILDYLVAYGVIGVCGYFKDSISGLITGSIVGIALRWAVSVTSGAVVFASYAPQGQNPWIYSMVYNASYMVPDGILNIVVLLFIYQGVKRGLRRRG